MSVIKTQICRTPPPRSANLCPDISLPPQRAVPCHGEEPHAAAAGGIFGLAAEQRPQGDIVGVGGGQRACCGAGGAAVGRRQGVGGGEG